MLVKHHPVPICFFGTGNIIAPFWSRVLKLLIRDVQLSVIFQSINPAVSYAVTELFLLSPKDMVGKIGFRIRLIGGIERFA